MSNRPTTLPAIGLSDFVQQLLSRMTLAEKIGQMWQVSSEGTLTTELQEQIRTGQIGSIINEVDPATNREIQRIAREESRLGIPILIARDVIHGFHTMMPIPLGQAASWNPTLVKGGARVAAIESAAVGINWTFAPMIDICRDPRWGRIAETLGEDPYLTSVLGVAMIEGFEGDDKADGDSIAACAKHFAGYGYSEAGRDYAYVNISENELRNVVLPPFKAAAQAGVGTFMGGFSDVNGIPASGNAFLMDQVLRKEWGYQGMVISDWDSILQMIDHGFSPDEKEAAYEAITAGLDMEMVSQCYRKHLEGLLAEGRVSMEQIDRSVGYILQLKHDLGLFAAPEEASHEPSTEPHQPFLAVAKKAAQESLVLLKNDNKLLPLDKKQIKDLAVIGPLADEAHEQLGTWTFDGKTEWTQTPLPAIQALVGDDVNIHYAPGLTHSRDISYAGYEDALAAAKKSEVVVCFLGEEAILSGEAHCRADIDLPGGQNDLLVALAETGKPIIVVVLAGRPLTLTNVLPCMDALLYAWHPGTMGGPAIAETLFGLESPNGKLPVTFPNMVGQIPIYYNARNSGRPANHDNFTHIDDIPVKAEQTSLGNVSMHIDAGFEPLYPFGFGLSYTTFAYSNICVDQPVAPVGTVLTVSADVTNTGTVAAWETAQLYIHDHFGSITRPLRELKGFQKVFLKPNETKTLHFQLTETDLAFFDRRMQFRCEPGDFTVWVGGDSLATLKTNFTLTDLNT